MKNPSMIKLHPDMIATPGLSVVVVLFSWIILQKGVLPALGDTRGDFANYYTASRLLADGVSIEPAYRGFVWFQKQMDRYGIQNQVGGFIPHPPSTALLFLPLAPLPPLAAKRVWVLFNVGLVLLNIDLLRRISGLSGLVTAALFLATGYGLLNNLLFGQPYLLLLASILLGIRFFQNGRTLWAGISLGLLVPMKYVGIVFLLYFLWKRQWRLVWAAAVTIIAVLGLTLWLGDLQSFRTFITEVFPRHLRGEIQDPYSVYWQSWNSLLRRMFLREETLNPSPAMQAPLLFHASKNAIFWLLGSAMVFVLARARFQSRHHHLLFQLGWVTTALLLLSPGSATYHFLLLTVSAVFFTKILLDQQRIGAALALGVVYFVLNLPHFMKLKSLAAGWSTPLAYPRLGFLLLFTVLTVLFFFDSTEWTLKRPAFSAVAVFLLIGGTTASGYQRHKAEVDDGARRLAIHQPEFDRHLGLIVTAPDIGGRELVFSYCELMDNDYAVYSLRGGRWTPKSSRNVYRPDLAADDSSLLVEMIVDGQSAIGFSPGPGRAVTPLVRGESPSWHPAGERFAYVHEGTIYLSTIHNDARSTLSVTGKVYDVTFSPSGKALAYCVQDEAGTSLRIVQLESFEEKTLLRSGSRITSPEWSADERRLLFSWDVEHNRDIWAIDVRTKTAERLTFHRAVDDEPVWDETNGRIIFTSDRGRGLGCTTLYSLTIPERWR